jgi:tRNA threonylcarbamoyladenosine biosynthesis protein TsaB
MNILSLETSSTKSSIALAHQSKVHQLELGQPRGQIAQILPTITQLLETAQLTLKDVEVLAFSAGPGSFTGIRVALGILQGIALATELPVAAVSSLRVLAQTAYRTLGHEKVITVVNAFMGEIYWGVYALDEHGVMQSQMPDQISKPDELDLSVFPEYSAVGDGLGSVSLLYPEAQDLIPLISSTPLQKIDAVVPFYLRMEDAWKTSKTT